MGETVNLRQRRKQQARRTAEELAAANRAKFGQPKAARELKAAETGRADADLDGKKLEK
jgi:hypothetical protein